MSPRRSPALRGGQGVPASAYTISKSANVTLTGISTSQDTPWIPVDGNAGEIISVPGTSVYRNWTFACWAKSLTELFPQMRISGGTYGFLAGVSAAGKPYHHIDSDNRAYEAVEGSDGQVSANPAGYHFAVVQQYTVGTKIYLNGGEIVSGGSTNYGFVTGPATWRIGKRENDTAPTVNDLQGVGFWTSALSGAQVASLATSVNVNPNTEGSPYFWLHVS